MSQSEQENHPQPHDSTELDDMSQFPESSFFNIVGWGRISLLVLLSLTLIGTTIVTVQEFTIAGVVVILLSGILLAILFGAKLIEKQLRR